MNISHPELGGALDPRSDVDKAKDWQHKEIAGTAAPIVFPEKPQSMWLFFSRRNQAGSSSCMAQSGAKTLGIENYHLGSPYIDLSALAIYRARQNFSAPGMWQQDLFNILCKSYACKESSLASQNMNEDSMNAFSGVLSDQEKVDADSFKASSYVFLPFDINEVASVIAQGKAVHLMFFFTSDEWWKPIPTVNGTHTADSQNVLRHGVSAVDFVMNNGKRCLVIEDSAGNESSIGGKGQRLITEDFFNARVFGAGYIIKSVNVPVGEKPKHTFATPLVFGLMNNADVVALQNILKYENLFPTSIPSTGNMLQITCGALKKWQVTHGITDFANVTDVRLVHFGPKSIALANQLYAA